MRAIWSLLGMRQCLSPNCSISSRVSFRPSLSACSRNALLSGNYIVTTHFTEEMQDDYLFFVDVKAAAMGSQEVNDKGVDDDGNPKVEVVGPTVDGRTVGVICSVRPDGSVLLITVYEVT